MANTLFCDSPSNSPLKHRVHTVCVYLLVSFGALEAGEISWKPETPYSNDRRVSTSADDPSPWASDRTTSRIEYRLLQLMEADRNAKKLDPKKLSEDDQVTLHTVIDHLDEALELSYRDAIPCFQTKANSTLLLMMLYHYEAHVHSAMERWEPTIGALKQIDPAITRQASDLAATKHSPSK